MVGTTLGELPQAMRSVERETIAVKPKRIHATPRRHFVVTDQ
jgi:hypothetical protein